MTNFKHLTLVQKFLVRRTDGLSVFFKNTSKNHFIAWWMFLMKHSTSIEQHLSLSSFVSPFTSLNLPRLLLLSSLMLIPLLICFLDAFSHLYKTECPSVRRSVHPLVTHELKPRKMPLSTKTTISMSEDASYAVYPALLRSISPLVLARLKQTTASRLHVNPDTLHNQSVYYPIDYILLLV